MVEAFLVTWISRPAVPDSADVTQRGSAYVLLACGQPDAASWGIHNLITADHLQPSVLYGRGSITSGTTPCVPGWLGTRAYCRTLAELDAGPMFSSAVSGTLLISRRSCFTLPAARDILESMDMDKHGEEPTCKIMTS
jgi:hypothetical protein